MVCVAVRAGGGADVEAVLTPRGRAGTIERDDRATGAEVHEPEGEEESVHMAGIKHFDHVGITVADLDAALDFFVSLGMEIEGRTVMEGEFLDTVCGIPNSRTEVAMLRLPGGGTTVEVCTFVRPELDQGNPNAMSTEIGLRNIAFEVEDLHAMVEQLRADGYELVGGIGEWENAWRMTYVRGPEGIIVALAERLG